PRARARLMVAPAPAALRATLAGPLQGSIGGPAFHVSLARSRIARQGEFVLEWNRDAFSFHERPVSVPEGPAQDAGRVAALARHGTDPAGAAATVVPFGQAAAGRQPSRRQRPAHLRA